MSEWQKVKIGDLITQYKDIEDISAKKEYKQVTVSSTGDIKLRNIEKGGNIKAKTGMIVKKGTFIYSRLSIHNGAFGIIPNELDGAIVTNEMPVFIFNESKIIPEFFLYLLKTEYVQFQLQLLTKGVGRVRIKEKNFLNIDVLVPDIDTQRILTVQILEHARKNTALEQQNNFQKSYLTLLRQQILQDAISGKLTAGWRAKNPDTEPAGTLLEKIKTEKEILIQNKLLKKSGNIKNTKTLRTLNIPDSWTWTKADQIFFVTKLAGFEYTKYIHFKDQGEIPVIRAQNVRPMIIKKDSLKYIDLKTSNQLERCALTKPCLLVTFIGAGIGDVAFFQEKERWHLAPNVAKMEPFQNCEELINLKFLIYFLFSSTGQKELFKHVKATAQPSLSMGTIRDIDFPFPPIAEQKAIVAKVEKLMEQVSKLEEKIKQNKQDAEMLMQSFLVEAFKN